MSSQTFDVYPSQAAALELPGRELLLVSPPRAGASYLLRVMAILRAATIEGSRVVLTAETAQDLRTNHLDGDGGLWAMLAPVIQTGRATYHGGNRIGFANGSSLRFTTWSAARREEPDLLLVDDGGEIPPGLFWQIRERALGTPPGAGGPKLVVAGQAGWLTEHWHTMGDQAVEHQLVADELPAHLRETATAARTATPGYDLSLKEHIERVVPEIVWYEHTERIVECIQRLFDDELPEETRNRLFIAAPPQAGKSTASQAAASYWLRRNPHLQAGSSAYKQKLARRNSRRIRDMYQASGGRLADDRFAVDEWELPEGGGLWSTGLGGGTGNPANFLLSDDLVKGAQEAQSKIRQATAIDWREGSWLSRWNPYGGELKELMIGTRWEDTDVQASALKEGGWHCLILPAIAMEEIEIPPGNTLEPDWREPGEALCEELPKLNLADLERMRDGEGEARRGAMSRRRWWALMQQQPKPVEGGGQFRDYWFRMLQQDPAEVPVDDTGELAGEGVYGRLVRAWDLAGTEGGGDATTSVLAGKVQKSGLIVFRRGSRSHKSPHGVLEQVKRKMLQDGPSVTIALPIDPGQAGKFQVTEYTKQLRAHAAEHGMSAPAIRGMPTSGSKVARAKPYREAAEPVHEPTPGDVAIPGNVAVVSGSWVASFLDEHHNFDGRDGADDDYVDAAADAFKVLAEAREHLGWGR